MSIDTTEILIVGATGKQGGAAISALLASPRASSLSLRFLTRNTDSPSAQRLINKGAEAIKGDLEDVDSLVSALEGVNRAFFMTDANAGEDKEVQQGKNFVDAAKKAVVGHVVFSSTCAADTPYLNRFRSKYEVNSHLHGEGNMADI
jgi:uncharacterized protein YbjT (DUF2867 family)